MAMTQKTQQRQQRPRQSPDLNPIENLWTELKVQVPKHQPQNSFVLFCTDCRQAAAGAAGSGFMPNFTSYS